MKQRGFTLIELLVAVVVLALLAGLGWRGLDSVARSRDVAAARQRQTEQLQSALLQLQDDLRQICAAGPGLPALGRAGGGDLLLIRRAGPDAGLQTVRWGVRDGRWLRWASPAGSGRGELLAARTIPTGAAMIMLDGVRSMQVQIWQQRGSDWSVGAAGAWVTLPMAAADATAPIGAIQPMRDLSTPPALRVTLDCSNPAFAGLLTRAFLLENRL